MLANNKTRKRNKRYNLQGIGIQNNRNVLEHIRKTRKVVEEVGISSGYAMPSDKLFRAKGKIQTKRKPSDLDKSMKLLREGKFAVEVVNGSIVITQKD